MLNLIDEIGRGKERVCFLHPEDSTKIIKVTHSEKSKQMEREVSFYRNLSKKKEITYDYFPKFYGEQITDKGIGYVFDYVGNADGSLPRSLYWFLRNGYTVDDFNFELSELRSYLLQHAVVFCNDMSYEDNILVKEFADGTKRLIVIDGLGDVVYFEWVNNINFLLRRKIKRRWLRVIKKLNEINTEC